MKEDIKDFLGSASIAIPILVVLLCFVRCTPEKVEQHTKPYECFGCHGTRKAVLNLKNGPSIISLCGSILESLGISIITGECKTCHGEGYIDHAFNLKDGYQQVRQTFDECSHIDEEKPNYNNSQDDVSSIGIGSYQPEVYDNYDNYDNYSVPSTPSGHYETTTERCIECLGQGYNEQVVFHGGGQPNSTIRRRCPFCQGKGTVTKREYVIDY